MEQKDIVKCFENGALRYLSKSASPLELIDYIKTLSRGERYIRGRIVDLFFSNPKEELPSMLTKLTGREKEVLELVINGNRNKDVANRLYISERTVEFHKQNIYSKLNVVNAVELTNKVITIMNNPQVDTEDTQIQQK